MAKKSFNEEESKPFDYFREVQAAKKQEKSVNENLVTALRSDLLSASEALPAKKSIFQRENLILAVGILLGLFIIVLIWYTIAGPGRPILEQNLVSLVHKRSSPSKQVTPTAILATNTPSQPTNTPYSSPTFRPTNTQIVEIATSPTPISVVVTPTPTSSCRDALTITLADVGKSMCVQGVVIETVTNPIYFMLIFSNARGAFYWVSYDNVWSEAELDTCYQIEGTINQIANSPMLVFGYSNLPKVCP
jgi:hypothetical protein